MSGLCARLVLALSLALAPGAAVAAAGQGPGAMAAEADHRAVHDAHGPARAMAGSGHHDATEHEHSAPALVAPPAVAFHPAFQRVARPDPPAAAGTIRDGPRRPPRPTAP
jgi:hypothetical protein